MGTPYAFAMRDAFEIRDTIVAGIPVDMIDFFSVRDGPYERLVDEYPFALADGVVTTLNWLR